MSTASWHAGVSKIDITPSEPIWLAGWGDRTEPSSGVSQPIFAKALALRSPRGKMAVWLTSDLLGYSKAMSDTIIRRAARRFDIDRERLILNSTHNHSGPVTGDLLHLYFDLPKREYQAIDRYTHWLLDRIVETIGAAIADLAPAELSFGQGLAGIAVNRRRPRTGARGLPTVVDQDVPVLAVRGRKGNLRAAVFGYACHTTCTNDGTINGDYAGWTQAQLEAAYPGSVAMFIAGCGGDANPLPRHRDGLAQAYGQILAVAVEQVLNAKMTPVTGPLRVAFDHVDLPFETLPTRQELQSLLPGRTGTRLREVQQQLAWLRDGDCRPRVCRYPIHVWRFGPEMTHVALCSEPVADYALRFKKTFGWDSTWVSGYNDEFYSYIPSLRVWREGGYEGHSGMMECNLPGPFAPVVEELIAAKVEELVQSTIGPRPYPRPHRYT